MKAVPFHAALTGGADEGVNQANGVRLEWSLKEPVVVDGLFLGGYGPGLPLSEDGLEVQAVAAPVPVADRRGPLGSVPLGCGEVDLDHLVHGEVGLCDRAVGVQEAKLEHGGLHLIGCPVDDSGDLSPAYSLPSVDETQNRTPFPGDLPHQALRAQSGLPRFRQLTWDAAQNAQQAGDARTERLILGRLWRDLSASRRRRRLGRSSVNRPRRMPQSPSGEGRPRQES